MKQPKHISLERTTGNLSRNIDPASCEKCGGQCCKYFEIWYGDSSGDIIQSEMQRMQLLKNIGKYFELVRDNTHKGYWLRINDPCKYLTPENRCEIHESEDRPLLCRMFPYPNSTRRDCPHITGRRKP